MLRVNGGPAHSGTVVKRERGGVWRHVCPPRVGGKMTTLTDKPLPGYWVKCPDCGTKRP